MEPEYFPQTNPETPPPALTPSAVPPPAQPAALPTENARPASHPFAGQLNKGRRNLILWILGGVMVVGLIGFLYVRSHSHGSIFIADTTPGLSISLNGQNAPASQSLNGYLLAAYPGVYRLTVNRPDYLPFSQDITVQDGETLTVRPIYTLFPRSQTVSTGSISFVRPSADGQSIFYLDNSRQMLYRFTVANQNNTPLTDPLSNITDVEWSSVPDVALIVQNDGVYLHEIPTYNFRNQIVRKIGGPEISSPVWDPTNPDRIAFAYYPPTGEQSLVFSDKEISSLERKANISSLSNPRLIWADDSSSLLLISRAADPSLQNLWIFFPATGELKQLTQSGGVVDASYSPDSKTILYQTASNDPSNTAGGNLSIIHPDGSGRTPLSLAGKVSLAAWKDSSSFYLPDPNHNAVTLYSLDSSGQSLPVSFPSGSNIRGMFYFPSQKSLIFYTDTAIFTVNLGG